MSNDARKVSELSLANSVTANDRLVILKNPGNTATTKTISVNNFVKSIASSVLPSTNANSVGYILTTNTTGGATWQRFTGVNEITSINDGSNIYTVTATDSVILVDPYVVGSNVTITLPIATAIEGKEILIKNVDASNNHKVIVTTDDVNNAYIEHPVTGGFVRSYELVETGQAETWIHDGNVYRHLNTARATPIFYTNANTYAQVVIKNSSNGINASTDLVNYNDLGDEAAGTGPFIDLGINSSQYSNATYSVGGHNDAYLFTDSNGNPGGNLAIGTASDASVLFHSGGTTSDKVRMTVNSTIIGVNAVIKEIGTDNLYINNPNNAIQLGASWLTQISATQDASNLWGSGNTQAYTWVYQEPENYAEAYSYIQANTRWADFGITTNANQAFKVTTSRSGLNTLLRYDYDGILHLDPIVGDIYRDGISVLGTGQIDGGNAFTAPTAEITVDGGGA